jgi:ubiquinone/menaquinone biosynthesis C-methylase UbiE
MIAGKRGIGSRSGRSPEKEAVLATQSSQRTDHASEERKEIAKHAGLYRVRDRESLRMVTSDWQKLKQPDPMGAYRNSMSRLGDIRGMEVLDAGCGNGWLSVILAKLGARVTAFDLSPEAVQAARLRTELNEVTDQVELHVASFYSMPFADNSFDVVMGQAILHHLRDKHGAAQELRRVLKPGGRAIFVECFGNVEWMERLRLLIPVPSSAPEDPDHWRDKLSYRDIAVLREYFDVQAEEFQMLSRLDRVFRSDGAVRALNKIDMFLLKNFPFLRRYARTVLLELRKGLRRPAAGRCGDGAG